MDSGAKQRERYRWAGPPPNNLRPATVRKTCHRGEKACVNSDVLLVEIFWLLLIWMCHRREKLISPSLGRRFDQQHNASREYRRSVPSREYLSLHRRGGASVSPRVGDRDTEAPSHRPVYFGRSIALLGHHHFGNRVSGAKWGIVRMPHAVTGPNETNLNQQNLPTPTQRASGR